MQYSKEIKDFTKKYLLCFCIKYIYYKAQPNPGKFISPHFSSNLDQISVVQSCQPCSLPPCREDVCSPCPPLWTLCLGPVTAREYPHHHIPQEHPLQTYEVVRQNSWQCSLLPSWLSSWICSPPSPSALSIWYDLPPGRKHPENTGHKYFNWSQTFCQVLVPRDQEYLYSVRSSSPNLSLRKSHQEESIQEVLQAESSWVLAFKTFQGCEPSISPVSPSKLPVFISPPSYLDFSGWQSVSSQGCQDPVFVPDRAVQVWETL